MLKVQLAWESTIKQTTTVLKRNATEAMLNKAQLLTLPSFSSSPSLPTFSPVHSTLHCSSVEDSVQQGCQTIHPSSAAFHRHAEQVVSDVVVAAPFW